MNNPFIGKITPDYVPFLDSVMLITRVDKENYLIYEETHKELNPGKYKFLDEAIDFMAFKVDSENTIISMVIYVEYSAKQFELLTHEFGRHTGSFTLNGETQGEIKGQVNYETISWQKDDYAMLVAFPQEINREIKSSKNSLTRIWITKLNRQLAPQD